MDLHDLLSDDAFDLPVPPGAVAAVTRRSARVRRRRRVLLAAPALVAVVALVPLLAGGDDRSSTLYGNQVRPTASPTPPPLPPQDPTAAVRMVCADRESDGHDPYQFGLDSRLLTGDPVADCARLGRRNGYDVPLSAYSTGNVSLVVVPASWTLPEEFRRLPAGFRADERRAAASLMFQDEVDGPVFGDQRCLTEPEATAEARDILRAVGLDYAVTPYGDGPTADGSRVCAWVAFPDEDSSKVLLIDHELMGEFSGPLTAHGRFVRELRTRVADTCLTLAEARQQVDAASTASGFRRYDVVTSTVGGDACTRVDLVSEGLRSTVVLRHA